MKHMNYLGNKKMAKGGKTASPKPKMVRTQFEEEEFEFGKGGFVGKGEMVWKKITNSQKMDFLYKNFTPEITPRSQEILVAKAWNFLPKNVKIKFEAKYANMEEYSKGGAIYKGDKVKIKKSNKSMVVKDISKGKKGYVEFSGDKGTYLKGDLDKYAKGGKISEGEMKILDALSGYNNGRNLNGILEGMFLSDFKSNKYATEAQTNTVKKNLNSLIKKGFVEEEGLGYSITQEGANYRRSNMAKGGKTKEKEPTIVRGFSDDEPYEYGSGGLLSGFNYSIGGL